MSNFLFIIIVYWTNEQIIIIVYWLNQQIHKSGV